MVKAVDRAVEIGASAIQIFSDNPTSWTRRAAPPRELPAWRERIAACGIDPVAIHASYLINLAGPDPGFWDLSIGLLTAELRGAPDFAARSVNVHIGSHRGTGVAAGTARLADGVRRILDAVEDGPGAAVLVLENSSGGGWGLGSTVEELAGIAEALAAAGIPDRRVAFCLDAAHAWGAGYRLSEPDETDALVEAFDASIGIGRLALVHLNDSKSECGSRMDRHEHVGAGRIGERGMAHLLRQPRLRHAVYLVETPGMDVGYDAINLERARALAAGRPLAPLPPGALELKGSRSRTGPAAEPAAEAEAEVEPEAEPSPDLAPASPGESPAA